MSIVAFGDSPLVRQARRSAYYQAAGFAANVAGSYVRAKIQDRMTRPLKRRRDVEPAYVKKMGDGYSFLNAPAIPRRKKRGRKGRKTVMPLRVMPALSYRGSVNLGLKAEIDAKQGMVGIPSVYHTVSMLHCLPMHVYELNYTPCTSNDISSVVFRPTPKTLVYNNQSGNYAFAKGVYTRGASSLDGSGQDADDIAAPSTTYNLRQVRPQLWFGEGVNSQDVRKVYIRDVKMNFQLFGQADQDTLYRIDIGYFTDDVLTDYMTDFGDNTNILYPQDTPPTSHVFTREAFNQWCKSMIIPYTQNPTSKVPRPKFFRAIKTYSWRIPVRSQDRTMTPCVNTNVKIPLERLINRYWKRGANAIGNATNNPENPDNMQEVAVSTIGNNGATAIDLKNDQDLQDTLESYYGRPAPRQRLFMIIRCTNTDTTGTGAAFPGPIGIGFNNDPTYNLDMVTRFSFLK